jgi:hypothetical protein
MALPCDTGNTGSARYTHAAKMSSAQKIACRHASSLSVVATHCTGQGACQRCWYSPIYPRIIGRMIEEAGTRIGTDGPSRCKVKRAVCYLSHGSALRHRQPGSARYNHATKMSSAQKIACRHASSLSVVATPCTGQGACQRRCTFSIYPRIIGRMIEEAGTRIGTDGPSRCHVKRAVCYAVGLAELELLSFDQFDNQLELPSLRTAPHTLLRKANKKRREPFMFASLTFIRRST